MGSIGCFGNSAEDRYHAHQLDKHLNAMAQADELAERQDELADQYYKDKLASLPKFRQWGKREQDRTLNLFEVLNEIPDEKMLALAGAITNGFAELAGAEIIKLVTAKLRKEAEYEAEQACE